MKDLFNTDLAVGDFVLIALQSRLQVGKIFKTTQAYAYISLANDPASQFRIRFSNVVKIEGPKLSYYLLTT